MFRDKLLGGKTSFFIYL